MRDSERESVRESEKERVRERARAGTRARELGVGEIFFEANLLLLFVVIK